MNFIDDPGKSRKMSVWLIRIVVICLIIYLVLRYVDVVGHAVGRIVGLFSPLILGAVIAFILNVAMRPIENHLFPKSQTGIALKLRRPLAIVISFILVAGILAVVIYLIVPKLVQSLAIVGEGIVWLADNISQFADDVASDSGILSFVQKMNVDFDSFKAKAAEWLKSSGPALMKAVANMVGSIGSSVINFVVGLVFSFYLLYDKENLIKQAKRLVTTWIPQRAAEKILHVAKVSNETFRSFVAGQTTEAVVLGTLCMIGMFILRIPYAAMIGALVGVTALIPVFGALIGMVVGTVMIITVAPVKALVFVIFLLILQQVEGNLIYPKVVGSRIGLPGLWVLAAVTIGGNIGGAVGMLAGVPAFSVIYTLLSEATDRREQMKYEADAEA